MTEPTEKQPADGQGWSGLRPFKVGQMKGTPFWQVYTTNGAKFATCISEKDAEWVCAALNGTASTKSPASESTSDDTTDPLILKIQRDALQTRVVQLEKQLASAGGMEALEALIHEYKILAYGRADKVFDEAELIAAARAEATSRPQVVGGEVDVKACAEELALRVRPDLSSPSGTNPDLAGKRARESYTEAFLEILTRHLSPPARGKPVEDK